MTKKSKTKKRNLIILISAIFIALLILFGLIFFGFKEETKEQSGKIYCTPEQRGIKSCPTNTSLVCGWFNQSVKCLAYPCADVYLNPCAACINPVVEFYTAGECPK